MEHEVKTIELAGGAKLLVIQLPAAVSFSLDIYVRSGYQFVDRSKYELPHLLEHLAFEGNALFPDAEAFKAEVEREGAYFNAWTNSHYNVYEYVSLPKELTKIVRLALAQVLEPTLDPEAIEHQKATVTNELRQNTEDFRRLRGYAFLQELLGSAQPSWPVRIKGAQAITQQDLRDFHNSVYQPANLRIVLSGHFGDEQVTMVEQMINQALEPRPAGQANGYQPRPLRPFGGKVVVKSLPVKNQIMFRLGFVKPEIDLESSPALRIFRTLYGEGFSSRMMMKGRSLGLTYSPGSSYGTDVDWTSLEFWDQPSPDKLEPLLHLMLKELAALRAGDYSDSELERAIGYQAGVLSRSYQTPVQYGDWYGGDFIYDQPLVSPEEFVKDVQRVDRAELKRVAKKYLRPENSLMVLLGRNLRELAPKAQAMITDALS